MLRYAGWHHPFKAGGALNPLEIRIERALQHNGLGICIYEVDAPYRFSLSSWSAVQRSFDIVLFGLPYMLTAF